MLYFITKSDRRIVGEVTLAGSKSISNRALIIQSLCTPPFSIDRLANAKDTRLLQHLLQSESIVRDAGAAGTTFRFLTARFAFQADTQILTGTDRMKKRPIGVLVEALQQLGADIEYLEEPGYPPLRINPPRTTGVTHRLRISASTSSQYISALLMIAPTLPRGLDLTLEGDVVSRPYIEMTLALMQYFGIKSYWNHNRIQIASQDYQPKAFTVEADWSAASYYYAMAAFADELDLQLNGLFPNSAQGDAVLTEMMKKFGIQTTFNQQGIRLTKSAAPLPPVFEYDFLECPDLAQTIAVVCAGLGLQAIFTGLQTLRIKETDRIAALKNELAKLQVSLAALPARFSQKTGKQYYQIEGKPNITKTPVFATYEDHRMAMAFAPLAMFAPIAIAEPEVVEKSYPDFWTDLEKIGFKISTSAE
ncbi:MAG TPA: 3-phosphoshikimate 1-carboxyvinyltransferase [Saprospiraceae bacterium]|nr:3-phosphoshikimate 1-carboxyvinyltransferase [Saprospiraceae bacterium]HMP14811.1 3-phosphoshikimate 1-carboxyvinyltransferase [Saprospiraceae bacterium]